MNKILGWLTTVLVATAVAGSIGLLVSDTKIGTPLGLPAALISAAPLSLIGISFLILQLMRRPRWMELLRNIMLAAAFILWGVVQFMEKSALSKELGDVVIVLYVLDLAWVILDRLSPIAAIRSGSPQTESSKESA